MNDLRQALAGGGGKDQLVAVLEQAILHGRLGVGHRLPTEREIAELSGLSRTTVRDALSRLTDRGLIAREVGRGTFVKPAVPGLPPGLPPGLTLAPSPRELIEFRRECEPSLAALVVMNASDDELRSIQALALSGRTARDWESCEAVDADFHARLYEATHNAVFAHIGRYLSEVRRGNVWRSLKQQNFSGTGWQSFQEQHERIMEHLLARDIRAARDGLHGHLHKVQGWAGS